MNTLIRPLLRPLPLVTLSTTALYLTATLSSPRTATMSTINTNPTYRIEPYVPRHATSPYTASDFTRHDSSPDPSFYASPRFVTHIDDAAIESLRDYYAAVLPRKGRILDFCSSWVSHYPPAVEDAAREGKLKVTGMGMNEAELKANGVLNAGRLLVDLNESPDIHSALKSAAMTELLDASTCVVSIDYLTSPIAVLHSLLQATKPGGTVHLTISNRCFPTKAMSRWLRVDEQERLLMVGDFLHLAGWKRIEIVEVSDGKVHVEEGEGSGLRGLMGMMGMGRRDPLWIVRGIRED
jgi:hypothetical protein